jgi:hypothetical protein
MGQRTTGKQKKLIDVHFPTSYKGPNRGEFLPPRYALAKTASYDAMRELGCIQATDERLFMALMKATANNPCNGCPAWCARGPACGAFQAHHVAWDRYNVAQNEKQADLQWAITPHNAPEGHPWEKKTMREIAEILTTSLSQVRDIKADKTRWAQLLREHAA